MKLNPKHRLAKSGGGRSSAASLMIGGLVAGAVATAGAVTLKSDADPSGSDLAGNLGGLLGPETAVADDTPAERTPADRTDSATALASLGSASIEELRSQQAAGRSEARSAPEDAAGVETVLAGAGFSGRTLPVEPEAVEPEAVEPEVVEPEVVEPEVVEEPTTEEPTAEPAEPEVETVAAAPSSSTSQSGADTGSSGDSGAASDGGANAFQAPEPQPEPAPRGGSITSIAAQYVGAPYVLPGSPPSTFDCSSYTWWVFQQAGIDIPRSVAGQKAAVTPVSDPQPGDLIFFNGWHHVAIYAGNGMAYEALNPGSGVTYGPLWTQNVWYGRIG